MGGFLTKEERRTLSHSEKVALRDVRRLKRWPETNGRRPWLVRAGDALEGLAQPVAIMLVRAAVAAIAAAAAEALEGGELRHAFAVDRLIETASENAITIGRAEADGLIADTFDALGIELPDALD